MKKVQLFAVLVCFSVCSPYLEAQSYSARSVNANYGLNGSLKTSEDITRELDLNDTELGLNKGLNDIDNNDQIIKFKSLSPNDVSEITYSLLRQDTNSNNYKDFLRMIIDKFWSGVYKIEAALKRNYFGMKKVKNPIRRKQLKEKMSSYRRSADEAKALLNTSAAKNNEAVMAKFAGTTDQVEQVLQNDLLAQKLQFALQMRDLDAYINRLNALTFDSVTEEFLLVDQALANVRALQENKNVDADNAAKLAVYVIDLQLRLNRLGQSDADSAYGSNSDISDFGTSDVQTAVPVKQFRWADDSHNSLVDVRETLSNEDADSEREEIQSELDQLNQSTSIFDFLDDSGTEA